MDDLDNFDVDDFDFDNAKSPTPPPKRKQDDAGLGIDEEIDIAKRARVPAVKLDENRLLSDKGIPKLRQRARKLKFKGKGHEYSDTAQLLSFYQFWLDDLFPKAKFLDALAMVEKLGHKKMVYRKRTEWIDELKPRPAGEDDAVMTATVEAAEDKATPKEPTKIAPIFEKKNTGERQQTPPMDDDDLFGDDDLHGLTPRVERATIGDDKPSNATNNTAAPAGSSIFGPAIAASKGPPATKSGFVVDDDEDDLDALMAEAEAHGSGPSQSQQPLSAEKPAAPEPDDFADEEAAMAEMEGF